MLPRSRVVFLSLCWIIVIINSCSARDNGESKEKPDNNPPATINFVNHTSFAVDIYKNLNPDYFDPTTLVCTVNAGTTQTVTLYASADQVTGDTFYPRYKVLLADILDTGTSKIYVDARRNLSNISFVVESGKTYTKPIPQPAAGELKFINGYIAVQNTGAAQVQIIKANEVLYKLDDNGAYLNPGQNLGYYEIALSSFTDILSISQLKAFGSSYVNFPEFIMERGKLYSFKVNNINTIDPPVITNLNPLRN